MLKYTLRTVGLVLIVLLLFLGSLFFREQRLPRFIVTRIEQRLSTPRMVTRFDRVSFGFRHGLRLQGLRIYDLDRQGSPEDPVARAQVATFNYWNRTVDVVGAEYRRLPDSYYHPVPKPEREESAEIELPELPELLVRLDHPNILGVSPNRVEARLEVGKRRIRVSDLHVEMPDRDRNLFLDGGTELDFEAKRIVGRVTGQVGHAQIAPVVETLDIRVALPYIAAFTEVVDPIPNTITWNADFGTGRLNLCFSLDIPRCRYQGVPMAGAKGDVRVSSRYEGGQLKYVVVIDLKESADREGRHLLGRLQVDNEDGPPRLRYDAKSELRFEDLLGVIDAFDRDTFAPLGFEAPPRLAVKGSSATGPGDLDANDLSGSLFLHHGSVIGLKVNDMKADFTFGRDVLETHSEATGKTGGRFTWHDRIYLQGFDPEKAHFSVEVGYRSGSLEELADLMKFDLGERRGTVDADLKLNGLVGTNLFATLNGSGTVRITDGKLAQMKLFAGLTEILAEAVPGVSYLVNQSQASADFEIDDGVVRSENVTIEGGLVSIAGRGSYDIVKDNLDFVVRVRLFKKDSLVGKVIHPLTSPIAWMLLEFRLTGPLDNPTWRRISLTDRIF